MQQEHDRKRAGSAARARGGTGPGTGSRTGARSRTSLSGRTRAQGAATRQGRSRPAEGGGQGCGARAGGTGGGSGRAGAGAAGAAPGSATAPQGARSGTPHPGGNPIHEAQELDSSINLSVIRAILDQISSWTGRWPSGSVLDGKVSHVQRSGRVKARRHVPAAGELVDGDNKVVLQTDIGPEAKASTKKDATKVGIGAGLGAVIGAIAGGGKGAAIGAAAGAGAGGATVMATRGEEVKLEVEQAVDFELEREVRIALPR